ncbi:MAG: PVC-type heme-binding CxxCH protein [Planctomycetota bacterium]
MIRLLTLLCLLACLDLNPLHAADSDWSPLPVPGVWEQAPGGKFEKYDGIAWYRCSVKVPVDWRGRDLQLKVQKIDNAYEAFVNGQKVGGEGAFPPNYKSGLNERAISLTVPSDIVRVGDWNTVAIRIYDHDGLGGFKGDAPFLGDDVRAIELKGEWQFRTGDDAAWAKPDTEAKPTVATFAKMEEIAVISLRNKPKDTKPPRLSLAASLAALTSPDDLEIEQVLTEPLVAQPLFVNFDERGRMWVMQYLQYPNPAGLKIVSKDFWWRAVYDKVPLPPPHGTKGKDKISIHEDTDGDGKYDKHSVFIDDLNIATSFTQGRGGVWVLNPPALLFYPDKNHDDKPDGDPEVHLLGFGLEDPHSVVNSMRWGPDGWLYGAQGSTVSSKVIRPGLDKPEQAVFSQGQHIWRYHPETHRYEIFSEGGGNAFGVDLDSQGRIFSGHNGGDTRGFHYMQGAYLQKGFNKHGPLTNPYAFGYFPAIPHHNVPRFTHCFAIYSGGAFPEKYNGKLFAVSPMLNHVVMSDVQVTGSTFKTHDIGYAISTKDVRFMPVDIKHGPDGALYVADWCDAHRSHIQFQEGYLEVDNGRIYRIKQKGAQPVAMVDFGKQPTPELIGSLASANQWTRQTVQRVLADRRDTAAVPLLLKLLRSHDDQLALEALWGIYGSGGWNDEVAAEALKHANPQVRLWTARLLGDEHHVSSAIGQQLTALAQTEPHVEVRSQLAATAKRLPFDLSLTILRGLAAHSEDAQDPRVPLQIWWAMEAHAAQHPDALIAWFSDKEVWKLPVVEQFLISRVMRRYASTGNRKDLYICAKLLEKSPGGNATKQLMAGFEEAYQGRSLGSLPQELVTAIAQSGGGSTALKVRQGDAAAIDEALAVIANPKAAAKDRLQYIQVLGQVKQPRSVPVLLSLLKETGDEAMQREILTSLPQYEQPEIATTVLELWKKFSPDVQSVALTLLSSRKSWALQLVTAVDTQQIPKESISLDVVRKLTVHRDEALTALITKHWGSLEGASTAEMQQLVERLMTVVKSDSGNPYAGKKIYNETCAKCHTLFAQGGQIGPDLTTYKRDDVHNILLSIVNPSAELREGFETVLIVTVDGRTLNGFLIDQDSQVVVLRGIDGQSVTIARDQIDELLPQRKSLMPEGLLKDMTEQQVRDLFGYLRSSQPLP